MAPQRTITSSGASTRGFASGHARSSTQSRPPHGPASLATHVGAGPGVSARDSADGPSRHRLRHHLQSSDVQRRHHWARGRDRLPPLWRFSGEAGRRCGVVRRIRDHGPAGLRKKFELREQPSASGGPTHREGPHDLRRGFAGWRQLGLDQRRAAQRQSGLLPPLLQKLFTDGRCDALHPVRQCWVYAPTVSRPFERVNRIRFSEITQKYAHLRFGVVGDFCLDRYLEIDPLKQEISIETGLPVHNVVNVRAQPGGAGTILNNLVALKVGTIYPVGFCGSDGEGYELQEALRAKNGVRLDYFLQTDLRRTFTYCKPLVLKRSEPPRELNRLDSKNWTPTPPLVRKDVASAIRELSERVDAMILLDRV